MKLLRTIILFSFIFIGTAQQLSAKPIVLLSPDKAVRFELNIEDRITYTISFNNEVIILNRHLVLSLRFLLLMKKTLLLKIRRPKALIKDGDLYLASIKQFGTITTSCNYCCARRNIPVAESENR